MVDSIADDGNDAAFRDCVFEAVTSRLAPVPKSHSKRLSKARATTASKNIRGDSAKPARDEDDPAELTEFSGFIASEIFSSLPNELQSLCHRTLQEDAGLAEKWSPPLTLTTFEELSDAVDPSVNDSLRAYGVIEPPHSDLQSFLSPIITSYISAVTVPPPKWAETRASECEICDRGWVPLTYHHLIPREVHAKVLKRGWHDEHMLNSVAWLCRACHSFVHKMASNEELAKDWFTVEKICMREDVQKWAQWVGRVRWKKT